MTIELKKLYDERAKIHRQQRDLVSEAANQENGAFTADQDTNYENLDKRYAELSTLINRAEETRKREKVEAEISAAIEEKADRNKTNAEEDKISYREALIAKLKRPNAPLKANYEKALRGGLVRDSQHIAEFRSGADAYQTTTTDAQGGYLVPEEWINLVVARMQAHGNVAAVATTQVSDHGGNMPIQTLDDVAQKATIIAQTTADTKSDITFGEITLGAYTYTTGLITASWEQLNDSSFESLLVDVFGGRMARGTNEHFTSGDGSGKPNGIVTAATALSSVASITVDVLIDTYHSIDPAYRVGNWGFMMNDDTLKAIRKLKDADNQPIFSLSYREGEPSTILGRPVYVNQEMDNATTGLKPIIVGDFSKYRIRRVKDMEIISLRERYADQRSTGYFGYGRFDADLLDVNAVKALPIT